MSDRQVFTREDILQASKDAIPQYGGESKKLRMLAFPSINIGVGTCVMVHEGWFEGPGGKDAWCVISFIEHNQQYNGHGDVETLLIRQGDRETPIPEAVFEEVWHRSCARYEREGGTIRPPSA